MNEHEAMGREKGRRSELDPIKPTGLGYRAASSALMALAVVSTPLSLLTLGAGNPATGLLLLGVAKWVMIAGVVLRIVSDFLAVLADIARAVKEG
jgi:hypothetical protein